MKQRTAWGTRARGYVIGLSSFGLGGAATVGVLAAMPNRMPIVDLPDFLQGGVLTALYDRLPTVNMLQGAQGKLQDSPEQYCLLLAKTSMQHQLSQRRSCQRAQHCPGWCKSCS